MLGQVNKNDANIKMWHIKGGNIASDEYGHTIFVQNFHSYWERRQDMVLPKQPRGTQPLLNFNTS